MHIYAYIYAYISFYCYHIHMRCYSTIMHIPYSVKAMHIVRIAYISFYCYHFTATIVLLPHNAVPGYAYHTVWRLCIYFILLLPHNAVPWCRCNHSFMTMMPWCRCNQCDDHGHRHVDVIPHVDVIMECISKKNKKSMTHNALSLFRFSGSIFFYHMMQCPDLDSIIEFTPTTWKRVVI